MKKNNKSITFQHAAAELCVSDSTILRLVQRGALHTTRPELSSGHWTRRIVLDRSFQDERARRLNGLKSPRRKTIPTDVTKEDPNPTQTVTPAEGILEKARNAMNICLEAQKACEEAARQLKTATCTAAKTVNMPAEPQPAFIVNARGYLATWHLQQPTLFLTANKAIFDFNGELDLVDRVAAHVDKTADYVSGQISSAEGIYTRCTAILAAACILQLLLAVYYTLFHFNII